MSSIALTFISDGASDYGFEYVEFAVGDDYVRVLADVKRALAVSQTYKLCGMQRSAVYGFVKRQVGVGVEIPYALVQPEHASGYRTVLQPALDALCDEFGAPQRVFAVRQPACGQTVGYEHKLFALETAYHRIKPLVHMEGVDDKLGRNVKLQRRADNTGISVAERRHGVEKVSGALHSVGDGGGRDLKACVGVSHGDYDVR